MNSISQEKFETRFPKDTRFAVVGKVLTQIKEGNFSQVVGIPGTGRSNLVGLLAYNKKLRVAHLGEEQERVFHFVPLNFTEIRGKNTAEVLRFVYLGILDSLHEREMQEEHGVLERMLPEGEPEELRMLQVLKRGVDYLAFEKKLKIVLLFDHFEEYLPNVQESFFAHLASLQLRGRYHFSVVFFLHRPLEQLVAKEETTDILKLLSGRTIFLPVKDKPLVDFLLAYTEEVLDKKLSNAEREAMLLSTGGHAKLVKVTTEEILGGAYEDVEKFLRENRAVRGVLYEIWGIFYPTEQGLLRRLSVPDTAHTLGDTDPTILGYLSHLDVIRDVTFTIPLFADFVKYREAHKLDEKITLDDSTGQIHIGGSDLSEKLTATEFALLAYLLRHPDGIVSRDELVAAAWGDLKSTAGVTDQAIDQLIYRIRQKIEENPRMPRHVVTVKGRGYRFLP